VLSCSDRPRRWDIGDDDEYATSTVRWVVMHMIYETAAHSGHLEIARELLDGCTDPGLR
jgi:hypothetical protein